MACWRGVGLYSLCDVVGLLDSTGALVVEYSYDAWGKPTGVTGSLAGTLGKANPLRYRGYVWDAESGLYYLQSRYYNPTWGRFISADNVLGKAGALLAHNVFAYCRNKPTAYSDATGHIPAPVVSAISKMSTLLANAIALISLASSVNEIRKGIARGQIRFHDHLIPKDDDENIRSMLNGPKIFWFSIHPVEVLSSYNTWQGSYVYITRNSSGSIWRHEYSYKTYDYWISFKDALDITIYALCSYYTSIGSVGMGAVLAKLYNDYISCLDVPSYMTDNTFQSWSSIDTPVVLKGADLWAREMFVPIAPTAYELYLK